MNFKKLLRWVIGILCFAVFAWISLWDGVTVREYVIYSENVTDEHVFAVAADLLVGELAFAFFSSLMLTMAC